MWASSVTVGLVAGGTAAAVMYRRHQDTLPLSLLATSQRLHGVHTASDAVRLLQHMARRAPTEDVAMQLCDALEHYGVDESLLVRLSNLHRIHGADNGARGYAINMIWGVMLNSIGRDRVVIYVD